MAWPPATGALWARDTISAEMAKPRTRAAPSRSKARAMYPSPQPRSHTSSFRTGPNTSSTLGRAVKSLNNRG
jgi:hypothetical protein